MDELNNFFKKVEFNTLHEKVKKACFQSVDWYEVDSSLVSLLVNLPTNKTLFVSVTTPFYGLIIPTLIDYFKDMEQLPSFKLTMKGKTYD